MSEPPRLVLVGGFLGSGKTTLILRAARLLARRGLRTAVITNDQDGGLVDTRLSEAQSIETGEVAGGCFCCRFSDFLEAAGALASYRPDVIFAEPVGSCIDISATILQPLKLHHSGAYRLAPFTVLVDPDLARRVFDGTADEDIRYLFRQQLMEADLVCTAKADLYPEPPALPVPVDAQLSAKTGAGVEAWLDDVLSGRRVAGARILDVDYDRYAGAEAALGWLNLHAEIRLSSALSPAALAGPLLEELDRLLTEAEITIAHLKIFGQTSTGWIKVGICANGGEPWPEGDLLAEAARRHALVVNLRALADPHHLEQIVRSALGRLRGSVHVTFASAFRPARPQPEHRFTAPVEGV